MNDITFPSTSKTITVNEGPLKAFKVHFNDSGPIVVDKRNRAPLNAAAIKGVLDAQGIGRAHVLGNSMGGAAALLFAMDFPDRCGKLVIMGGGAGGKSLFVPMPTTTREGYGCDA
jgi:pimeloyl-ACP methyl ester carboxylesterase